MNYNIQYNVGKSIYLVNFYNGISKHKDGSNFYDVRIFKNKKVMNIFIKSLNTFGYNNLTNN